jgi:hypothetical protein
VTDNFPDPTAQEILSQCFDVNASRVQVDNLDELAGKMAGTGIDDDEEDDEGVGY